MQVIMPTMRAAYEQDLKDREIPQDTIDSLLSGISGYQEFCEAWLNRTMGHDQVVMSADRQQYLLTNRAGDGNLPDSGAVNVTSNPYRVDKVVMPDVGSVQVTK
jgi:hypothetical protein